VPLARSVPRRSNRIFGGTPENEDRIELVIGDTLSVEKRPDSWVVQRDGTRTPLALKLPVFDSRERPWYREAVGVPGITWLDDIRTFDNLRIASASMAVRDPRTGSLRGVFDTQFFLDALPAMLREAAYGRSDIQSLLVTRHGSLIATSFPPLRERRLHTIGTASLHRRASSDCCDGSFFSDSKTSNMRLFPCAS